MNRLWEILFKPAEIYEGMKEDPSPVLPMVTVVVILAVCAVLAVALVDSEAILAEQLEVQATMLEQMNVPEEQREMQLEQTRQALQSPAAGVMGLISAPAGAGGVELRHARPGRRAALGEGQHCQLRWRSRQHHDLW